MACNPEPSVTNSKAAVVTDSNDTATAFYECLSGFSMSGSSRIYCNKTLDVWDTAPSCVVIDDNVYVYNYDDKGKEWWYYFLAALLTAILLLLMALVIWCWCCAPRSYFYDCRCCCFRQRSRRLQDRTVTVNSSSNGVRKDVFWIDSNDNKYWSNQALGHYLYSDNSQNGSLTSLITNRRPQQQPPPPSHIGGGGGRGSIPTRDIGVEAQLDSPSSSHRHSSRATNIPNNKYSGGGGSQKSSTTVLMGSHFRQVLAEVDTPERSVTSKGAGKDGPLRASRPAKDPTAGTRGVWMPHSHSIRDINTSTK